MSVMTVLGSVPGLELGPTQVHEHLVSDSNLAWIAGDLTKLLNHPEVAVEELRGYRDAGGRSLVDVTTPDLGRDPEALRAIAEASDVYVIMGCGFYREPYYPSWLNETSTAELARRLVTEIEEGVGETGIRPGIIGEIGSHKSWVSGVEERVFRAAGRAQRETGLPVMTHSPPRAALEHLSLLRESGADPARVALGHCDSWLNFEYHEAIAKTGAFLSFDLIGHAMYPDEWRADHISELVRRGFVDQILLSTDTYTKTQLRAWGGGGYGFLRETFLPRLREKGVSDDELERITVANPARLLSV
jgi:predicted metal-dependent phosphotriesterase family hydrolase